MVFKKRVCAAFFGQDNGGDDFYGGQWIGDNQGNTISELPLNPVYPIETALGFVVGGGVVRAARTALSLVSQRWRGIRRGRIASSEQTLHGAQRLRERGISDKEARDAIRTAEQSGQVFTQTGKYGTPQKVYKGINGVTVIIETSGRNAGKVITLYRR